MNEENCTLTIELSKLTNQECFELIEAISKILKENNVSACQVEFWTH